MRKLMLAVAVLAALALARPSGAEDKTFPADKGPDSIDVSKYPKAQQEAYEVFAAKCSRCHTLARPINSDYALPAEWTTYVFMMRHKPRSGIDDAAQKTITDFLIYDSSVRKKDLIAKKLAAQKAAAGADKSKE